MSSHQRQRPAATSTLRNDAAKNRPTLTPQTEQLRVGDQNPPSPPKKQHTDRVPFGTYLPEELHRALKAQCALKGIEIQQATEHAIREWLDRNTTQPSN